MSFININWMRNEWYSDIFWVLSNMGSIPVANKIALKSEIRGSTCTSIFRWPSNLAVRGANQSRNGEYFLKKKIIYKYYKRKWTCDSTWHFNKAVWPSLTTVSLGPSTILCCCLVQITITINKNINWQNHSIIMKLKTILP